MLIPKWYSIGASIASVIAEFSVAVVQFIYVRNQLDLNNFVKLIPKYFVASILMLFLLKAEDIVFQSSIINTILMIFSGGLIYFVILIILHDNFILEILNNLKKKIKKE